MASLRHRQSSFYSPTAIKTPTEVPPRGPTSVSLSEAITQISTYLENQHERPSRKTLVLRLEPCTFSSLEFTHILESINSDEYDFRYQPDTCVFCLLPLPRFIHDAFGFFLQRLCHLRLSWLTPHEQDHLSAFKSSQMMTGSAPISFVATKGQAMEKEPDVAIVFGDLEGPDNALWPVVVAEVGFSQPYNSLLIDARQWLLKADKPPNLVMLLKINEDTAGLRKRKTTDDYAVRVKNLLRSYADGHALAKADMDGEGISGHNFDPQGMKRDILMEDWVGPMQVFFELWMRDDTKADICLRGQRYSVIPAVQGQERPVLLATDLIPDIYQSRFKDFDPNRQTELDFVPFQTVFTKACRTLAESRAWDYLRPGRVHEFSDPDYQLPDTGI